MGAPSARDRVTRSSAPRARLLGQRVVRHEEASLAGRQVLARLRRSPRPPHRWPPTGFAARLPRGPAPRHIHQHEDRAAGPRRAATAMSAAQPCMHRHDGRASSASPPPRSSPDQAPRVHVGIGEAGSADGPPRAASPRSCSPGRDDHFVPRPPARPLRRAPRPARSSRGGEQQCFMTRDPCSNAIDSGANGPDGCPCRAARDGASLLARPAARPDARPVLREDGCPSEGRDRGHGVHFDVGLAVGVSPRRARHDRQARRRPCRGGP